MRKLLFIVILFGLINNLNAQKNVYTIQADSVKLTGCDSSELIIENHTRNIPGFLFNTGNGRTAFKRGALRLNDSTYLIGADTLKTQPNAWLQGGNAFGATGILGTIDSNHLDVYTNNMRRLRVFAQSGNVGINSTGADPGYKLDVNGTTMLENTAGPQLLFNTQYGVGPFTMGYESGYNFNFRTNNGGQGAVNMDFSGLNGFGWTIDPVRTNTLVQQFVGPFIMAPSLNNTINFGDLNGSNNNRGGSNSTVNFYRVMDGSYYNRSIDPVITIMNGGPSDTPGNVHGEKAYWYRNGYIGIGTSNNLGATAAPRAALTINQGTLSGYNNLNQNTASTVNTTGSSTTVTFLPNNGNALPTYGIITGTVITANGVTRTVVDVQNEFVVVDSAVDWSAGYTYTYRNPYIDISDGSTPVLNVSASGMVGIGNSKPLSSLDITGANGYSQLRLKTHYTPSSSSDTNGNPGDIAVDDNYFYYKTSAGWKRAPLSSF